MKQKMIPLVIVIAVSLSFIMLDLDAQSITRVDGQPLSSPICLNQDYVLQIIPGYTCSNPFTYVWEKDSGEGEVTFSSSPGIPGRIVARFSSASGINLRVKIFCNSNIVVTYFGGGFTTGIASPVASNVSRCGSGTVTLQATPSSGNSIRWYSSQGTLLSTSNTYSPTVSSNTTYYASSYNTSGSCVKESASTPVFVSVYPIPLIPTTASVILCGQGSTTLTASPGTNGNFCNWYSSIESTGQIIKLNSLSNTYTTPVLNSSTIYNVTTFNTATGCESNMFKVTVTISIVSPPTSPNNPQRCGPGPVTFSATPAPGTVIRWYPTATTTFLLGTGSSFTASSLSTNTTVYASCYNSTTGCYSSRIPVTATINPIPAGPSDIAYNGPPCSVGTQITATADISTSTCKWYPSSTSTSSFFTGATYTMPSLATYYITSYNQTTGCESTNRAAAGCAPGGRLSFDSDQPSITEQMNENGWLIYPNPSSNGKFSVEISKGVLDQNVVMQVLDSEGREHAMHQLTDNKLNFETSLLPGLYIVKLRGRSFMQVKKLIVL